MPRPVRYSQNTPCKIYSNPSFLIVNKESKYILSSNYITQVAIKRDAGQELEVQKWMCDVLGQPALFDEAPYEDVLKVNLLKKSRAN